MKKIILIIIIISLFSCKNESEKMADRNKYFLDSLKVTEQIKERLEKEITISRKDSYLDTTGMKQSPVIVTHSKLFKKEYTNYKDIELSFKNVSNKNIQGIRFEWYGENSFGEPADMGNYSLLGEGGGFTDQILKSKKSSSAIWEINSKDAKKIIAARAYEVAFTDGTIWKLRKD